MGFMRVFVCCVAIAAGPVFSAFAQPPLVDINQKTITLLAGEPAWFDDAQEIADGLAHEQGLHILPMQGTGCIDSTADVLQLTQIDVAVLSADCVDYAEQQGLLPQATKKLAYISRLKALPLIIVTRRDIPNLTALAGRRIATGPADSAAFASGEILLGGLGLPFIRVAKSGAEAIVLLTTNATDAVLLQGFEALDGSLDPQRFHALGLPTTQNAATSHAPTLISAADVKGLLPKDSTLETVSTALVLAAFNWPEKSAKAAKIKLFSSAFIERQAMGENAMQLSASVPGWQRHDSSQKALEALTFEPAEQDNTMQQGDGS